MIDVVESQEIATEEEARAKIRRFVDDPHLKFHISVRRRLSDIVQKGIISHKLAERAGMHLDENFMRRPGISERSVSVGDRDKNPTQEEAERFIKEEWKDEKNHPYADQELGDWWIKWFLANNDNIGFLLPSDTKIRPDQTPFPNESLVPFRIKPGQIEGLFVVTTPDLQKPFVTRRENAQQGKQPYSSDTCYAKEALETYFKDVQTVEDNPEYIAVEAVEKEIDNFYMANLMKYKGEWPPELKKQLGELNFRKARLEEEQALTDLEKILGKKRDEICEQDILVYFARKLRVPLYAVDRGFRLQVTVWPRDRV